MDILGIVAIAYFLLVLWFDYKLEFKTGRRLEKHLNFKPFTCRFCLFSWVAIILSVVTFNPSCMALILFYKV